MLKIFLQFKFLDALFFGLSRDEGIRSLEIYFLSIVETYLSFLIIRG